MKGEKICAIEDEARANTLAEQPTVACGRCGAKANEPANVCDPIRIPAATR